MHNIPEKIIIQFQPGIALHTMVISIIPSFQLKGNAVKGPLFHHYNGTQYMQPAACSSCNQQAYI